MQIHTPTVVQGGVGGRLIDPLPGIFDMLQGFETILPLEESLWSSQQDEVYSQPSVVIARVLNKNAV